MSSSQFPSAPIPPSSINDVAVRGEFVRGAPANSRGAFSPVVLRSASRRLWLHSLLFLLTIASTTILGVRFAYNFDANLPPFDLERDFAVLARVLDSPALLLTGLPYSLTLMTILLAHELGHYLACVYYRIDASLPYFLPAPTFIGTLGAFIRFRSPIYSRKVLFDVGSAGPFAGFVFVLPALAVGLSYSKVIPGIVQRGDMAFGTPLLLRLMEWLVLPGVPSNDIYLHPIARAAWVGLLATALNLLPIGQLDGGHILYSFFGDRHGFISTVACLALIPMGLMYWPWALWGVLLLFFARRHFSIMDPSDIGAGRRRLGLLALVIFVLCFIPEPVLYNSVGR